MTNEVSARRIHRPWASWWLLPMLGCLALACTPLGLWMYEDPLVTVSRVRLDAEGTAPVVVALDVLNPNDYTISTTRFELRLSLDDQPIGRLARDSSVSLPQGTATVALRLIPDRGAPAERVLAFRTGAHRFLIEGRATLTTPIGERRVRFAQEGDMAFGAPTLSAQDPSATAGDVLVHP